MKDKKTSGILLAILAAALYAVNSPFSKLLLDHMPPTLMAGFLYIGAGLGMVAIAIFRKAGKRQRAEKTIGKAELPYTYFIALGLMVIGAWLCASDEPLFKKK